MVEVYGATKGLDNFPVNHQEQLLLSSTCRQLTFYLFLGRTKEKLQTLLCGAGKILACGLKRICWNVAALKKDKTPTGFDLEGLRESSVIEFEKQAYSPSKQLRKRSYKSHVINNALENARHVNRSNLLRTSTKRGTNSSKLFLSAHMLEHKIYPTARRLGRKGRKQQQYTPYCLFDVCAPLLHSDDSECKRGRRPSKSKSFVFLFFPISGHV